MSIDVKLLRTGIDWGIPPGPDVMRELLDRLEAAERLAESRWDGAIEANQERDALASHLEELRAVWDDLTMHATYETLLDAIERKFESAPKPSFDARKIDVKQADQREQALEAHVEHLDGLRKNVIEAIRDDRFENLDASFYRDDMQPPKPETSLARLIAEKQAAAYTKALDVMYVARRDEPTSVALDVAIKDVWDLRRQAEDVK